MNIIALTQNQIALVDDEDFELVNQYSWFAQWDGFNFYAVTNTSRRLDPDGKQHPLRMHNLILEPNPSQEVDHKNGNGLDNRRSNLRVCTHAENSRNIHNIRGKSKYDGVSWHSASSKWRARINVSGKRVSLGYFLAEEDAAAAIRKYKGGLL